jgi:hypothetical protein
VLAAGRPVQNGPVIRHPALKSGEGDPPGARHSHCPTLKPILLPCVPRATTRLRPQVRGVRRRAANRQGDQVILLVCTRTTGQAVCAHLAELERLGVALRRTNRAAISGATNRGQRYARADRSWSTSRVRQATVLTTAGETAALIRHRRKGVSRHVGEAHQRHEKHHGKHSAPSEPALPPQQKHHEHCALAWSKCCARRSRSSMKPAPLGEIPHRRPAKSKMVPPALQPEPKQ